MSDRTGPVYEVTLSVDAEFGEAFDIWLANHVTEMLQIPGFVSARVYAGDNADDGRMVRVTHYVLESDADLAQYLAGPAELMRQSAIEHFADRFSVSRRVLHDTEINQSALKPVEPCLNCDATLVGQYCGACGQRAQSRLISIWELVQDAFGDLFELDSRVWRTLIPLVARPGKLTLDYLQGRRVRFMPPFRTYLVLSIFFFLIAFFDPREQLGILFQPEADVVEETGGSDDAASQMEQEILQELVDEGIVDAGVVEDRLRVERTVEPNAVANDDADENGENDEEDGSVDCDFSDMEGEELPPWLATRLTQQRLEAVCERVVADKGKAFSEKLRDNVPAGLFILLPLMALVLKLLYPLSKRYYVEHLLFIVHFHAFFFLILILQILFGRLVTLTGLPDTIASVTTIAASLYIPVYLYKAMRRVYGQGHLATVAKYLVLMAAYFAGFSFIFLFAAAFAALSI